MPPQSVDAETISKQMQNIYLDLEGPNSVNEQQIKVAPDNLEPIATDLKADGMIKHDTEQALRLNLEEVTEERDHYEKKLKALSVVLAEIGTLKKENDELREENSGLAEELVDVNTRMGNGVAFCLGYIHWVAGPRFAEIEAKVKSRFYGSVSGDPSVE